VLLCAAKRRAKGKPSVLERVELRLAFSVGAACGALAELHEALTVRVRIRGRPLYLTRRSAQRRTPPMMRTR
jgi:hypothetical protein